MCKLHGTLFLQFSPTLHPNVAISQCAHNHLSISHILSLHPWPSRKSTHFDTVPFLRLKCNRNTTPPHAPNALWVSSRPDLIVPYFGPVCGKLTDNTEGSYVFHCCSSTFVASLSLCVTHTHCTNRLMPLVGLCSFSPL